MLKRNIKLVFSTNALMLSSGVVTSLLSAWALGPAGRGDLIIVLMWPAIFSMVAQLGLPSAYRFWTAKRPECVSALFSNAVVFTLLMGLITLGAAELLIPLLIGHRSEEVVRLARIYLLVIPILMLTDLLRGLLEGARRFTWVGVLRLILFGVQLGSFIVLWLIGRLTVASACYTMVAAVSASLLLSFVAVWRELHPHWQPRLSELGTTLRYGIRDYPGVLTEFVNWRLDLMMLVGVASSASVGLYAVALRLADISSIMASSVGDALMPEVAAAEKAEEATQVVTRSLRLTLAAHLLILMPLWIAAPYILRFAYGVDFLPVTNVLRLLIVASVAWSAGAIVISGLNGLGHPGLSAIARITAALVMVVALRIWLPSRGIQGAALASITGYSVMFLVALFWLLRRRQITLWECLRPRWGDIPRGFMPASLRGWVSQRTPRRAPTQTGEALTTPAEHTVRLQKKDDLNQVAATQGRERAHSMVTWKLLTDEAAKEIWDEALLRLDDYTPFQSYAWGEYRRALGWEPCRWAAFDEHGKIVAMMLGQLRRYLLGFGLIWTEGGPVGDLSVCGDSLQQAIHQSMGVKRLYIRFRCDRPRQIEDVLRLNSEGWGRSWFNLTPNFSMSLDLNREEDRLLAACDRNWRRNLRRANESRLSLRQWLDPDAEEVLAVYASMQKVKGLEEQLSLEEIAQLLKHCKEQLVLYRCDDESGELVSLLGWAVLGKRAWAVLWATSESGRKLQASHAIFWALVQHCLKLKVETCDLAGIDPVQNHGVYRFKRDTGAVPLEYLGEWDWGSRPWMRWFGNWAIARRSRIKQAEAALVKSRPNKVAPTVNVPSVDSATSPEFPGTHLHCAPGKL